MASTFLKFATQWGDKPLLYHYKEEPKHMSVRIEVQIVSDCQINEDLLFVLAPIFF